MEYISLGDLVELKQGMAINKKSNYLVSSVETSLPLLRIADMPTKSKVVFMDESTPERFIANQKDLIYTRTGQVGLVFRNQYGVVHNNCFRVIPKYDTLLDRSYLYWCLSLKSIYEYANIIASGAAQPDLPHGSFKKIKIPVFSLHIQEKIAAILDFYDLYIENNDKRIKILEQMVEKLYKEVFSSKNFDLIDINKSNIGNDYTYVKIREVMTFDRGISYSSDEINCDEGLYLVNLKNIDSYGGFRRDGYKKYNGKYKSSHEVNEGDLVMGITDMTQDRRTVGHVALIPSLNRLAVISADLVRIDSKLNNIYLYCLFKYGGISKYISQFANGSNVLHLRPSMIKNIKIPIANENLVFKFVSLVTPIYQQIEILNIKNDNLIKQRDLLLPRLMSGKLEIK